MAWSSVWEGGVICLFIVSGFCVKMAGPGICVLCSARICASYVHPVFNSVAPYRYLLPNMYLSVADIANPDFLGCCLNWISFDIARFYEEQCQPSSRSALPAFPTNGISEGSTQFAQGLTDRCNISIACRLCRLEPHIIFINLLDPILFVSIHLINCIFFLTPNASRE